MIRKFNPNILHIVSPFGFTLQGVQIARQLGIPVVASYHTDIPGFAEYWGLGALSSGLWAYFRWVHNQADITFVPTHFTQRQIEAQGFKRVRIWGRGVDTTLYSPTRRSEAWRDRLSDEHPDMPIMLYTGRLAPEKRIELLLPVIQSLHGVRLAIVGDGPQRSQLEKLFAGTPTIFTGYLHGLELAQAYASADIFTFTGAKETFGNVILEAMASGLPVIAPNSGGVIEHIQDGVNGLLYPVGEERALTKTVEHLVHNPGLRQAMAKAAYEYSQHLSWEDIMRHLVDNYQEAHRKPFRQFSAARSQPIV
jgi:glycosyltransferase involved in cell wall biosynthesis